MIETHNEISECLITLTEVGIFGFPITRNPDGIVTHPKTYTDYKNNPTESKVKVLINDYPQANGVAVIAGFNYLCCIDFDLKNTTDKDLFKRWKELIYPGIIEKCYIELTRSGGYHVFFFCKDFQHDALPAANEDGRAVIEFFCKQNKIIYTFPTPGYTEVNISLYDTGELTTEEATNLLHAAELFNKYKGKRESYTTGTGRKLEYPKDKTNIFQDFDFRVDSSALLGWFSERTGWKYQYKERRKEFELWHPKTSVEARSAVYFEKTNRMICFSESQHLFPSWMQYDEAKPTPYIVTPTHILYRLLDNDFEAVEKEMAKLLPAKIEFKVKKWLLNYVEKDYLKNTINKLGQKKIAGKSTHTIFVDSYLLVYLMHLIDPEFTWTCEGFSDEYFSKEDCKSYLPEGAKIGYAFGESLYLDKEFNYPLIWNA